MFKTNYYKMENKNLVDEAFIWSEEEAILNQHVQKSQSACGESAIINVLVYFLFLF